MTVNIISGDWEWDCPNSFTVNSSGTALYSLSLNALNAGFTINGSTGSMLFDAVDLTLDSAELDIGISSATVINFGNYSAAVQEYGQNFSITSSSTTSIDSQNSLLLGTGSALSVQIAQPGINTTAYGQWIFTNFPPRIPSSFTGFLYSTGGVLSTMAGSLFSTSASYTLTGNWQFNAGFNVASNAAVSISSPSSLGLQAVTLNIGTTTNTALNLSNSSATMTVDATTLKIINAPTLATVPPYFLVLNASNQVEQYALAAFTNTSNSYFGVGAGNTGANNVGVGYNALHVNSGSSNVAVGFEALLANTSGGDNTATGYGSMANNTIGSSNTAYGYLSLLNNTSGNDNTAIGESAMYLNTSGGLNCALGAGCLQSLGSGNNNVALGTVSLENVLTGSNNTAVGYNSGSGYTGSESNNLCLGANVVGTAGESNVIRIGNSTQTAMYIYGPASETAATAAVIGANAPSTVQPAGWVTMIYNPTTQQVGYYTQV